MKILHITTVRSGSTGRTATDLKEFYIQKGEEFKIAFSERDEKPINGDILIGDQLDHKIHAFLSRLLGLQGYFSYVATKRFLKKIKAYRPDIVVLGILHANYLNLPLLFSYLAEERIPVVMILHDCWLFTGKCTHFTSRKCDKWKTECNHCPAKRSDNKSWLFDCSAKIFRDRLKWYNSLSSLTVIAVSDWEKLIADQSPLFANANVIRIYNWINTDVFKPATEAQIQKTKEKYNLSSNIKYVISVSAGWSLNNSRTKDAISLAGILPKGYQLIVVGRAENGIFPENVIYITQTSDQLELAALYSLSVAYLHFSVEDTFGKVIAEAMACETVPIVFDSTACKEIAGPFGIAITAHNIEAMIKSIPLAENKGRCKNVRSYALENYCRQTNLNAYGICFNNLLSSNKKAK
jgi:glycosyltransferase involved in cell wall biosynthesis